MPSFKMISRMSFILLLSFIEAFIPQTSLIFPHRESIYLMLRHNDVETLEESTVAELKAELRSRGLAVSGVKQQLIERLASDMKRSDSHVLERVSSNAKNSHSASFHQDDDETDNDSATETFDYSINSHNKASQVVLDLLPEPLFDLLSQRTGQTVPKLLPVQERAFKPILNGSDAVLSAPTGSGKTLGYALPLFSRLLSWKQNGTLKKRERFSKAEYYTNRLCRPSILVLAPSRELAKQVGQVLSQYHPTSSRRVAAVFGGVPIERHISLLRRDLDVIVGTPGRVRELIREGHLCIEEVKSIVLDEADVLLNFDDQPEIKMLLDGMTDDYQLVLASATVNWRVKEFVKEIMGIDEKSEAFIILKSSNLGNALESEMMPEKNKRPIVGHWSMPGRSSSRTSVASDLILTLSPRIGIVFVASRQEANRVSQELSKRLTSTEVSVLEGDMSQSARSRTIARLRENNNLVNEKCKILVATDVASRGLDVFGIDLVLQFGIPRKAGKDGTYDSELYLHRAGRAGRIGGGSKPANIITLYDPLEGEGKILPDLEKELSCDGIEIKPRALPSPVEVMEASYIGAMKNCDDCGKDEEFVNYFREKIISEFQLASPSEREERLINKLAAALASLSELEKVVTPRSLLTADTSCRTIRAWSDESAPLSPSEVIRFAKGLGSGKLGRVTICKDGSAVFDLPVKKVDRFLEAYHGCSNPALYLEIPSALEF
mmetsp:Transcript_26770/g.39601  ORF Transcript_26770/g.39601 Transcript_26770/m.39601 type:complete len:720 (+) Transcript_26770:91-2250(+)|eukprot:CAMPEP_0194203056 /NCGR_PEP_ID=MMETSP0156-20130528/2942_1 /TAXON_ID=33649 /ORGANISM="Thalassionema nitzschioides, Strain L26-B" /LENGTH=719 /DNA_ID=CAMNT_0038928727 /DNA_START=49 /DNA_END=2208 /DNA_ORIENTATION=+